MKYRITADGQGEGGLFTAPEYRQLLVAYCGVDPFDAGDIVEERHDGLYEAGDLVGLPAPEVVDRLPMVGLSIVGGNKGGER